MSQRPQHPQPALPTGENAAVYGTGLVIPLAQSDPSRILAGEPREGLVDLGALGSAEVTVRELRTGSVSGTELDEVCVILSGNATIDLLDEDRTIVVGAGDVLRLVAGSRTRWTVLDHLRRVSLVEPRGTGSAG